MVKCKLIQRKIVAHPTLCTTLGRRCAVGVMLQGQGVELLKASTALKLLQNFLPGALNRYITV